MEQTIALYQRELKSIDEQMSKVSTNNTQVEMERLEAETLQKISNDALNRAKEFAADFEAQVQKLVPQIPAPLQDILKKDLARIPADPADTKMLAAERVQTLVGILNEIDKFNNALNVFSERRKTAKGEAVAVETVYIGLGATYFVNGSGDFAGMGGPRRQWVGVDTQARTGTRRERGPEDLSQRTHGAVRHPARRDPLSRIHAVETNPQPDPLPQGRSLPTSRNAGHRGRFLWIGIPLPYCPEGTSENSPAFQRWVGRQKFASPEGTAEVQSHTPSFSRPFGTCMPCGMFPGIETPGYSQDVPPGQRNVAAAYYAD